MGRVGAGDEVEKHKAASRRAISTHSWLAVSSRGSGKRERCGSTPTSSTRHHPQGIIHKAVEKRSADGPQSFLPALEFHRKAAENKESGGGGGSHSPSASEARRSDPAGWRIAWRCGRRRPPGLCRPCSPAASRRSSCATEAGERSSEKKAVKGTIRPTPGGRQCAVCCGWNSGWNGGWDRAGFCRDAPMAAVRRSHQRGGAVPLLMVHGPAQPQQRLHHLDVPVPGRQDHRRLADQVHGVHVRAWCRGRHSLDEVSSRRR